MATTRMETTHGPTSSMAAAVGATAWQQGETRQTAANFICPCHLSTNDFSDGDYVLLHTNNEDEWPRDFSKALPETATEVGATHNVGTPITHKQKHGS